MCCDSLCVNKMQAAKIAKKNDKRTCLIKYFKKDQFIIMLYNNIRGIFSFF